MKKKFTLSIFTENRIGLLNRISIVFTKRHINIDRITASESEIKNVYRFTILVFTTKERISKALGQIEKQIEVIKGFIHEEEEVVYRELAMYKLAVASLQNEHVKNNIKKFNATIIHHEAEFVIVEKVGHAEEIQELLEQLKVVGVLEFSRSGRVAITKPMKELRTFLKEMEVDLV